MTRIRRLTLLPAAALLLGGCVAGMVAGAASMAAGSGSGERRNIEFMQAAARQACSAHAAQYGAVQIVSVTQAKNADEIVVSGTVANAGGNNSFECSFVTEITGFVLRPVQPGT
jgi:hypothetical protein